MAEDDRNMRSDAIVRRNKLVMYGIATGIGIIGVVVLCMWFASGSPKSSRTGALNAVELAAPVGTSANDKNKTVEHPQPSTPKEVAPETNRQEETATKRSTGSPQTGQISSSSVAEVREQAIPEPIYAAKVGDGGRWLVWQGAETKKLHVFDVAAEKNVATIVTDQQVEFFTVGKGRIATYSKNEGIRVLDLPDGKSTGIGISIPDKATLKSIEMGSETDERIVLVYATGDAAGKVIECRGGNGFEKTIWKSTPMKFDSMHIDHWCEYANLGNESSGTCVTVSLLTGDRGPTVSRKDDNGVFLAPFAVDRRSPVGDLVDIWGYRRSPSGTCLDTVGQTCRLMCDWKGKWRWMDGAKSGDPVFPSAGETTSKLGHPDSGLHVPKYDKALIFFADRPRCYRMAILAIPPSLPREPYVARMSVRRPGTSRLPRLPAPYEWKLLSGPQGFAVSPQGACTWPNVIKQAVGRYMATCEMRGGGVNKTADVMIETFDVVVGTQEEQISVVPGIASEWIADLGVDYDGRAKRHLVADRVNNSLVVVDEHRITQLNADGHVMEWAALPPKEYNNVASWNDNVILTSGTGITLYNMKTRNIHEIPMKGKELVPKGIPAFSSSGKTCWLAWDPTGYECGELLEVDMGGTAKLHSGVKVSLGLCVANDRDFYSIIPGTSLDTFRASVPWVHATGNFVYPFSAQGFLVHYKYDGTKFVLERPWRIPDDFGVVSLGLVAPNHEYRVGRMKVSRSMIMEKAGLILSGSCHLDLRTPPIFNMQQRYSVDTTDEILGCVPVDDGKIAYLCKSDVADSKSGGFSVIVVAVEDGSVLDRRSVAFDYPNWPTYMPDSFVHAGGDRYACGHVEGNRLTVMSTVAKPKKMDASGEQVQRKLPAGKSLDSIALVQADGRGVGTAFCVSTRGTSSQFVTNHHVVDGSASYSLVLQAGTAREETVPAKLYSVSPNRDLAILSIEKPVEPLPLSAHASGLALGVQLSLLGFPFGDDLAVAGGRISATVARMSYVGQMDDSMVVSGIVCPGNSGGPLLDQQGNVCGVIQKRSLVGNEGYAIPVESLKQFLSSPCKRITCGYQKPDDASDAWNLVVRMVQDEKSMGLTDLRLVYIGSITEELNFDRSTGSSIRQFESDSARRVSLNNGIINNCQDIEEGGGGGSIVEMSQCGEGTWQGVIPLKKPFPANGLLYACVAGTRPDGTMVRTQMQAIPVVEGGIPGAIFGQDNTTTSINDKTGRCLVATTNDLDLDRLNDDVRLAFRCGEGRWLALLMQNSGVVFLYNLKTGTIDHRIRPENPDLPMTAGGWRLVATEEGGVLQMWDLRHPEAPPRRIPPPYVGRILALALDEMPESPIRIVEANQMGTTDALIRVIDFDLERQQVMDQSTSFEHNGTKLMEMFCWTRRDDKVDTQWCEWAASMEGIGGLCTYLGDGVSIESDTRSVDWHGRKINLGPGQTIKSRDGKGFVHWSPSRSLRLLDAELQNPVEIGKYPVLLTSEYAGHSPKDGSLRVDQSLWLDLSANQLTIIPVDDPSIIIRRKVR